MRDANRRRRRQRSTRGRMWLAVGGVIATAVALVAFVTGDDDGARPGTASRRAERLDPYQIVLRVTELGLHREETIIVRPPYESLRLSERDGVRTATLSNREGLWQLTPEPSHGWQLLDPGPRRAEGDVRPLGALELLANAGLAERRADESVLGRPCTAYRVAEPIGFIATKRPTDADHVDLCVDRTGLLLHERWVADGTLVREQEAIDLDLSPQLAANVFVADPTTERDRTTPGRNELPLTEEIREQLAVAFDLPPTIVDDGGAAILELDPTGQLRGGTVHRFLRRGDQLVDVEEVEADRVDPERGLPYDVPLGEGLVETDLRTVKLTIVLPGRTAVILRGPDLDLLDTVAEAIRLRDDED